MNTDENQIEEFCVLLKAFHAAHECADTAGMESLASQLFSIALTEQARNPSENLFMTVKAAEYMNAAKWEQAETTYRCALAIAEAERNCDMIYKGHSDLSRLFMIRGMREYALLEANKAVEATRESRVPVLLSVALGDLSLCHLMNGDIGSATVTAEESVQTVPAEKMTGVQRARAQLMRARCRVSQGRIFGAKRDLDEAWQLLAPFAQSQMFGGVLSSFANWWEITAQIRIGAGDLAEAAEALGNAVGFRRTVSQLTQLDGPCKFYWLAIALKQYGAALLSAGKVEASAAALDESRSIQEKTGITLVAVWNFS